MNISGIWEDKRKYRIVWLGIKKGETHFSRHTSIVTPDSGYMIDAIRDLAARQQKAGYSYVMNHIISCKIVSKRKTY